MGFGCTTQKEHVYWPPGFPKGDNTQMPPVPSMWAIGLKPGAFKTPLERLCMHFNATPCVEMSPLSRTQDLRKESVNLRLSWPKLTVISLQGLYEFTRFPDLVLWSALPRALKCVQRIEMVAFVELFPL